MTKISFNPVNNTIYLQQKPKQQQPYRVSFTSTPEIPPPKKS